MGLGLKSGNFYVYSACFINVRHAQAWDVCHYLLRVSQLDLG